MVKNSKIKKLKKQARNLSIKEGIFASAQNSFGNYYVSPFAIALNASNSMVALLSSVSGLLGPLSQLTSPKLLEKFSRKKVLSKSILIEALMWIPFILTALLFYKGIFTNLLPIFILLLFSISTIAINIGTPAWFSWMGDIIDDKYRGRWFAKRNLILGFVSVILAISASFLLDYFKKIEMTMIGFGILFFLALIFRFFSYKAIKKQYEPKMKKQKIQNLSFLDFTFNLKKNNFGKFTLFRALLGFACSINAPFLAIYLLRNLNFSYTIYMIITLAGTLFSLFIIEIWGKFSDKYGNYKTLLITSIVVPIIPFLWILSPSKLYLILIPTSIGGISWAGFNLAATNFVYDNINREKRSSAISYYNILIGIGVFLGASLGAILIKIIKTDFINPILLIFILGGLARMIVVFWYLPKIREVKKTKKFKNKKTLKNLIFKEAKLTFQQEVHQIISIGKYLK